MLINNIKTTPFNDQCPGTSGLRKKVAIFQQENYLENFIQSILDVYPKIINTTLVLGGDGRFYNRKAIQIILSIAAANNVHQVIVGQGGLLSTPATSYLIRKYKAGGGMILSASHNPGGINGDFGIKLNVSNGGPASEALTEAIYIRSKEIRYYKIMKNSNIDLDSLGQTLLGQTQISIIDPVSDYTDLMQELFDFNRIRTLIKQPGFVMAFDAMHAVTGPYAKHIFEEVLGAPVGTVINSTPLPDFGGSHPDPNLVYAANLVSKTKGENGINFAAASDGDGDRNMILGKNLFVTPSDSLAILAANATMIPGYCNGLSGVARSMPTSQAIDRVAEHLNINVFETPTGWKFFSNLLDAGKVTLCGEESFGTGSNHVREKDGLWTVLFWLNLLAVTGQSVTDIVTQHWKKFGRHYYSRYDFEAIKKSAANKIMNILNGKLVSLKGSILNDQRIIYTDNFSYTDPIDRSVSSNQGICFKFENNSRIVFRLSGTGTNEATMRIYFEKFEAETSKQRKDTATVIAPLVRTANKLSQIVKLTGREQPNIIT